MSIGNALFAILSTNTDVQAIVGAPPAARIFSVVIPQGKQVPAVVYNLIAGEPENVFDGGPVADRELVQIDAWAEDYDTATRLRDAVRAALSDQAQMIALGIGVQVTSFYPDMHEDTTKRYGRSIAVTFWTD